MNNKKPKNRPNIVIILADDMGYGDVRYYNPHSKIPTPHMDRMASEGLMFTDAHSASAVCTPSRYGLLTGRYCWRTPLKRQVLYSYEPPLVPPERPTLAGLLQQHGYHTACIGKWHLGLGFATKEDVPFDFSRPLPWPEADRALEEKIDFSKPMYGGPTELGFDYFFGTSGCSTAQPPYAFIEGDRFVREPSFYNEIFPNTGRPGMTALKWDHKEVDTTFTEKAEKFIYSHKNAERPFFLYLAASAPHEPCVESVVPDFAREKSLAGPRGDLVWLFDWMVGRVASAIKDIGQYEDTLFIITSDNGALPGDRVLTASGEVVFHTYGHLSCGELRGYKHHIWEGGHREPFIVTWPGHIREGTVTNQLFCLNDIYATLADLLGIELSPGEAEDSYSVASVFLGADTQIQERTPVVHHSQAGVFSLRTGPWKLIHESLGSGAYSESALDGPPVQGSPGQLYHLDDDPAEEKNMFSEHPDIVASMVESLEQLRME